MLVEGIFIVGFENKKEGKKTPYFFVLRFLIFI